MPSLFPARETLQSSFYSPLALSRLRAEPAPYQAYEDAFGAWSAVDDAKDKAKQLSAEAAKEFEKASAKAQAKTGHIELYSGKYYAACTFGGLIACVSPPLLLSLSLCAPSNYGYGA